MYARPVSRGFLSDLNFFSSNHLDDLRLSWVKLGYDATQTVGESNGIGLWVSNDVSEMHLK